MTNGQPAPTGARSVRVSFDRIGCWNGPVAPLVVPSGNPVVIAEAVVAHVRQYLMNPELDAVVDLDAMTCVVVAAMGQAGVGKIEFVEGS